MQSYIRLLRIKHYVKNLLVFVPLFFNKGIFNREKFLQAFLGFVCFCFTSSAVYVLNDLCDVEKDRNHPTKKSRPIANGSISIKEATILECICLLIPLLLNVYFIKLRCSVWLLSYFLLNVAYSFGLKNYPVLDVVILASGFVIRILFGGSITNVAISKWLYLVIVFGSLYMGLGKRRNELRKQTNTREVLNYYSESFLDKNMYVSLTLVIVFYALWSADVAINGMIWSVPVFVVIMLRYSFIIEGDSDGDPVEVLMQDRFIMLLGLFYLLLVSALLYYV